MINYEQQQIAEKKLDELIAFVENSEDLVCKMLLICLLGIKGAWAVHELEAMAQAIQAIFAKSIIKTQK